MHIFFSGIGGTGLGPLALIAHQAGYSVSGSDKQDSKYISYLRDQGIENIEIGQSVEQIAAAHAREPIDWFVYSSAVAIENPDAPEFRFCRAKHIKESKRDVLLNTILSDKGLKLLAIAGTHGKTTTTAMAIWLCKRLRLPVSYSVGAKMSFGEMGEYHPDSQLFIYEADEFDHNFLAFQPYLSIITGIDWDHHDIYPTREEYEGAFEQFLRRSNKAVIWKEDAAKVELPVTEDIYIADKHDPAIHKHLALPGRVNRQDAWQVAIAIQSLCQLPYEVIFKELNAFPGVSRRFEKIKPGLYSDYAHTVPKIVGTLQTAYEIARPEAQNVVVVYEGLHNTRQHFIKDDLKDIFDEVTKLYIVPTYLAREDKTLPLLSPSDLKHLLSPIAQPKTIPSQLDDTLKKAIDTHLAADEIVVCISAGGGGSLDEWLRKQYLPHSAQQMNEMIIPHEQAPVAPAAPTTPQ